MKKKRRRRTNSIISHECDSNYYSKQTKSYTYSIFTLYTTDPWKKCVIFDNVRFIFNRCLSISLSLSNFFDYRLIIIERNLFFPPQLLCLPSEKKNNKKQKIPTKTTKKNLKKLWMLITIILLLYKHHFLIVCDYVSVRVRVSLCKWYIKVHPPIPSRWVFFTIRVTIPPCYVSLYLCRSLYISPSFPIRQPV